MAFYMGQKARRKVDRIARLLPNPHNAVHNDRLAFGYASSYPFHRRCVLRDYIVLIADFNSSMQPRRQV